MINHIPGTRLTRDSQTLEKVMAQPPEEDKDPATAETYIRTAAQARDVTRTFLASVGPSNDAEAEAVLLVVSELVTNAERHAGGVTGFRLSAGPGSVTVTVSDASTDPPRLQRTNAFEPGGFGWYLVQELAVDVTIEAHPYGKSVQAVLPVAH
ncbi:ATP-binding protein [Streptomyces sp. NBC_00557]|uniref:ATP-binding protein n=1 Tax=Streptomyces sp. NBC_00557 TaxID=2975776 RepID=UPI002E808BBE|nr:ATP-binding protein [Streptomyces sp. NBC_00557]WUC35428.1 ATP-binding protein [Streptomyces sp. NBC_00557]